MGCIKADKKTQKSKDIAGFFGALFETFGLPIPIPNLFFIMSSKYTRPGMDATVISSSIKSRFNEIGIPTGGLEDGDANVMENYTDAMTEEIVDHLQTFMRIDVAIEPGKIITNGANGAGAVVGVNLSPTEGAAVGS